MPHYDVVVIGAGAAGMMCAIAAGRRGRSVLVIEHNKKPGEKIRISGGGRCNFTNLHARGEAYLSRNPKFVLSALARYSQHDFLKLVDAHGIAWHEKTLGQLFCDGSAQQIIDMLLAEMSSAGARLTCGSTVSDVRHEDERFVISLAGDQVSASSLVVATGGKSIPKMGATGFGYKLAEQFGVAVTETRPALVPLTFSPELLAETRPLSGVGLDTDVSCNKRTFTEAMLFTHRGLSGPSILQISSYWREGVSLSIDMAPQIDVVARLKAVRAAPGKREVVSVLSEFVPKSVAQVIAAPYPGRVGEMNDATLGRIAERVKSWRVTPVGSEGYRTAEVTLGGVDTKALDPKTMAVRAVPGLYFIGEVVDVTGWLGGYNFQWAWSSGWVCGSAV